MNDTLLVIALLGPPAVYGLASALEDLTYTVQLARRRARESAMRRHPSHAPLGPEDHPDWGTR